MRNLLLDTVKRRNFSAEYLEQEDPAAHPNYEKNSRRFAKLPKFKNLRISPVFLIGAIATIAVPINALFFQDGRHPAPLFRINLILLKQRLFYRLRPSHRRGLMKLHQIMSN